MQKRRFTKEFEAEAVRLVQTSGRTQRDVADDLGVNTDPNWTPQPVLTVAQVVGIASLDVGTPPPIGVEPQGGFTEDRKAAVALYGVTSLTYEFLDGANVAVSGTDLKFAGQKFGAELGLGGTLDWADGAHTLHGELLTSTSFQGSYAVKSTLGFNSQF